MLTDQEKEQLRTLLNKLNLGTQKADLGSAFVALVDKVENLEARVTELETE